MPFKSRKQVRAAFGGFLGPEMQAKAHEFAAATPGGVTALPERVKGSGSTRFHLSQAKKDTMTQVRGTNPDLYTNTKKTPKGKPKK